MTPAAHADLILREVHLLDPADPPGRPASVALLGGKILAVGRDEEVERASGPDTQVESLGGRTVLPGLVDCHLHLERYARALGQVDCATDNLEGCLARLRAAADSRPPGTWIEGHGWDQNVWGNWPTVEALDRATPDHPVYLTAHSLHAAAANSLALSRAGVHATSPDPAGGHIQRGADGQPTGVLLEEAMALVGDRVPEPSTERTAEAIAAAQEKLWQVGLVGVHDYDGARCFSALQLLRSEDRLGLRVLKNLRSSQLDSARQLGLRSGWGDEWLQIGSIKIFTDGALGPRTAAMIDPYDDEGGRGMLLLDEDEIFAIADRALAAGFAMTIHAIGDRANGSALRALARLAQETPERKPPLPHRIEHVQLIHPSDVGRLHELGVVASMQPIHAISDRAMAEAAWGERISLSYPWRSLERAGTTLAFGSDAPVEDPNPFWGLHAAVCRCPHGQHVESAWTAEQRISLRSALTAYTRAPARIAGGAGQSGALRPGYHADLIVLDENPFEVEQQALYRLAPVATMVAGQWRVRTF